MASSSPWRVSLRAFLADDQQRSRNDNKQHILPYILNQKSDWLHPANTNTDYRRDDRKK
jgi:hypothetical protein